MRKIKFQKRLAAGTITKILKGFSSMHNLNEHIKLKTIVYHYYSDLYANMDEDSLIILVDYKNPFDLGVGTDQTGDAEFGYQSGPVFGLVLIYKVNGVVTRKYVLMVVKKVGAHTGYKSCTYTKHILQFDEVMRIARGRKKVYVGSDGASHFFCEEFTYFVLRTIKEIWSWVEQIRFVPFAKYHGKSDVDRLFSIITCWYWANIREEFLGTVVTH